MNEHEKLLVLRRKLVSRRRALADSFVTTPLEQLTGEAISRIQEAIDAVDRALEDEARAAELGKDIGYTKEAQEQAATIAASLAVSPAAVPIRSAKGPPGARQK